MPIIRCTFNFGNIYLTSGGLASSTNAICQNSVSCTTRTGEAIRVPFKGFTSIFRMKQFENLTMHNIKAIKAGNCLFSDQPWHELGADYIAVYIDGAVYLVLNGRGHPIIDKEYQKPKPKQTGVLVCLSLARKIKKSL